MWVIEVVSAARTDSGWDQLMVGLGCQGRGGGGTVSALSFSSCASAWLVWRAKTQRGGPGAY